MGMNRPPVIGQCVYCGQVAEQHDDHVPPKSLFPKPKPSNLITVPCCRGCNKSFEKDDEYFKTSVALCLDADGNAQVQQIIDGSVRALSRKERDAYRALYLSDARRVMVEGTSDLYLPSLAITLSADRFQRFGRRLVRGLYYAEAGQRLPSNCQVQTCLNDVNFAVDLMNFLLSQPAKIIDANVFAYRFAFDSDEPLFSAWILAFYGRLFIAGTTVPTQPR